MAHWKIQLFETYVNKVNYIHNRNFYGFLKSRNVSTYEMHCKSFERISKKRLDNKSLFYFISFTFCNIFIECMWHFKHIYNYYNFFCSVKIQIQNTALSNPTQQEQGQVLTWNSLTIKSKSCYWEKRKEMTYRSSRTPLLPSRGEERTHSDESLRLRDWNYGI